MYKRILCCWYIIFLYVPIYSRMGVESQNYEYMVKLKLVDDNNKMYPIARWKIVQETSQSDVLDVPGITEQEISDFDKELDAIDLSIVENNKDALKKEIKKKIILHHLSPYKTTFDYLLVAMIADNIRNKRVKVEEVTSFKPESVQQFPRGQLLLPPIHKLGKDSFNGKLSLYSEELPDNVMTIMPLSTMMYTSFDIPHEKSCVNVKNSSTDEQIGIVCYDQKNITGLGFTTDLRYLVTTFDNKLVSKTALYSDEDYTAYKDITDNIKLIDIYLLHYLYKAKEQGRRAQLDKNEDDYIRNHLTTNQKGKEFIQKHFLS